MIITSKYPSETDARGAASGKPPTLLEFATKKRIRERLENEKNTTLQTTV